LVCFFGNWYRFKNHRQPEFFISREQAIMKQNEPVRALFTKAQANTGMVKPEAPAAARQSYTDHRAPDPSSVLRSERYPIPDSFEYRTRTEA
jgi:hypothetical protein